MTQRRMFSLFEYERRYLLRLGPHGFKIKKYLEELSLEERKKLLKAQMKLDRLRMLAKGVTTNGQKQS